MHLSVGKGRQSIRSLDLDGSARLPRGPVGEPQITDLAGAHDRVERLFERRKGTCGVSGLQSLKVRRRTILRIKNRVAKQLMKKQNAGWNGEQVIAPGQMPPKSAIDGSIGGA